MLCIMAEEIVNHILIHCDKARLSWDLLFTIFRFQWILLGTIKDPLLSLACERLELKEKSVNIDSNLC